MINAQLHHTLRQLLLQDELNVLEQRMIERHAKAAEFREKRTLNSFDFSFNASIDRRQISDFLIQRKTE